MNRKNLSPNEKDALELIEAACKLMGWGLIIPNDESNEEIHYFIIGSKDGLETALVRLSGGIQ